MMRHFKCPDCKKKGVFLRLRARGEDNFYCRYCYWCAFRDSAEQTDYQGRFALRCENPERGEEIP